MMYPEDDAMLTEIFRKHYGACPVADVRNDVPEKSSARRNARLMRSYGMPLKEIGDVLDIGENTVGRYTSDVDAREGCSMPKRGRKSKEDAA